MNASTASAASVSVVVPVYRNAATLSELTARLHTALAPTFLDVEVILVNDGSEDDSWSRIEALAAQYPWVRGVDLARNYGQHNAVLIGTREARGEIVVTIDDDLQHPPEEIPRLIAKLNEGYDIVYGLPEVSRHGLWRNFASWTTKFVLNHAVGIKGLVDTSAFRVFRTPLRDAFKGFIGLDVDLDALLSWSTARYAVLPVRHDARWAGVSTYTLRKLVVHTITMLVGFSVMPLRLASIIGFVFVLFGLGLFVFVISRYLLEGSIPGFPFLASAIALFSGAQLFAVGIIGEYMARMHFRVMGRPPAVIRTRTDAEPVAARSRGAR